MTSAVPVDVVIDDIVFGARFGRRYDRGVASNEPDATEIHNKITGISHLKFRILSKFY